MFKNGPEYEERYARPLDARALAQWSARPKQRNLVGLSSR